LIGTLRPRWEHLYAQSTVKQADLYRNNLEIEPRFNLDGNILIWTVTDSG